MTRFVAAVALGALAATPAVVHAQMPSMEAMGQLHARPLWEAVVLHVTLAGAGVAALLWYRAARRRRRRAVAPAAVVTEAVLVVDLVGSTRVATHYGDRAAMHGRLALGDRARREGDRRGLVFTERTGDGRVMTFATVAQAVDTARAVIAGLSADGFAEPGPRLAARAAITYGELLLDPRCGRHGAVLNKAFRLDALTEDAFVGVDGRAPARPVPRDSRILLDEEAAQEGERLGLRMQPIGFCGLKGFSGLHRVYELATSAPAAGPADIPSGASPLGRGAVERNHAIGR